MLQLAQTDTESVVTEHNPAATVPDEPPQVKPQQAKLTFTELLLAALQSGEDNPSQRYLAIQRLWRFHKAYSFSQKRPPREFESSKLAYNVSKQLKRTAKNAAMGGNSVYTEGKTLEEVLSYNFERLTEIDQVGVPARTINNPTTGEEEGVRFGIWIFSILSKMAGSILRCIEFFKNPNKNANGWLDATINFVTAAAAILALLSLPGWLVGGPAFAAIAILSSLVRGTIGAIRSIYRLYRTENLDSARGYAKDLVASLLKVSMFLAFTALFAAGPTGLIISTLLIAIMAIPDLKAFFTDFPYLRKIPGLISDGWDWLMDKMPLEDGWRERFWKHPVGKFLSTLGGYIESVLLCFDTFYNWAVQSIVSLKVGPEADRLFSAYNEAHQENQASELDLASMPGKSYRQKLTKGQERDLNTFLRDHAKVRLKELIIKRYINLSDDEKRILEKDLKLPALTDPSTDFNDWAKRLHNKRKTALPSTNPLKKIYVLNELYCKSKKAYPKQILITSLVSELRALQSEDNKLPEIVALSADIEKLRKDKIEQNKIDYDDPTVTLADAWLTLFDAVTDHEKLYDRATTKSEKDKIKFDSARMEKINQAIERIKTWVYVIPPARSSGSIDSENEVYRCQARQGLENLATHLRRIHKAEESNGVQLWALHKLRQKLGEFKQLHGTQNNVYEGAHSAFFKHKADFTKEFDEISRVSQEIAHAELYGLDIEMLVKEKIAELKKRKQSGAGYFHDQKIDALEKLQGKLRDWQKANPFTENETELQSKLSKAIAEVEAEQKETATEAEKDKLRHGYLLAFRNTLADELDGFSGENYSTKYSFWKESSETKALFDYAKNFLDKLLEEYSDKYHSRTAGAVTVSDPDDGSSNGSSTPKMAPSPVKRQLQASDRQAQTPRATAENESPRELEVGDSTGSADRPCSGDSPVDGSKISRSPIVRDYMRQMSPRNTPRESVIDPGHAQIEIHRTPPSPKAASM